MVVAILLDRVLLLKLYEEEEKKERQQSARPNFDRTPRCHFSLSGRLPRPLRIVSLRDNRRISCFMRVALSAAPPGLNACSCKREVCLSPCRRRGFGTDDYASGCLTRMRNATRSLPAASIISQENSCRGETTPPAPVPPLAQTPQPKHSTPRHDRPATTQSLPDTRDSTHTPRQHLPLPRLLALPLIASTLLHLSLGPPTAA